jgi:hypothetical protein
MAFMKHEAPWDLAADQTRYDITTARAAALSLPTDCTDPRRTNQVARTLAHELGTDPHRLATCANACPHRSEGLHGPDPIWRCAERLAWNALILVEALRDDLTDHT